MYFQGKIEDIPVPSIFYFAFQYQLNLNLKIFPLDNNLKIIGFYKGYPVKYTTGEVHLKFGDYLFQEGFIGKENIPFVNSQKSISIFRKEGLKHLNKSQTAFLYKQYLKECFTELFAIEEGEFILEEEDVEKATIFLNPLHLISSAIIVKTKKESLLKFYNKIKYSTFLKGKNYNFFLQFRQKFSEENFVQLENPENSLIIIDLISVPEEKISLLKFLYFGYHCGMFENQEMAGPLDILVEETGLNYDLQPRNLSLSPPSLAEASENQQKGSFALKNNEIFEAIEYFSMAFKLNPYNNQALSELAFAQFLGKKFEEAEKNIQSAILNNDLDPRSFYCYGNVLREKKEFSMAIIYFKMAMKLQPTFQKANDAIFELQQMFKIATPVNQKKNKIKILIFLFLLFSGFFLNFRYCNPPFAGDLLLEKKEIVSHYQITQELIIIILTPEFEKFDPSGKTKVTNELLLNLKKYRGRHLILMDHFGNIISKEIL